MQRRAETPKSISLNWRQCGWPVKVSGINEWEDHLLSDRQHNSSDLSVEGRRNPLQDLEWCYEEDPAQMSQE